MIRPATLAWREGRPWSERYGDIYHDASGAAEVERVFLQPAGFDALLRRRQRVFVAELGFGTGLNFAVTARHCQSAGVALHYLSVEAEPIDPGTFRRLARARSGSEPVYGPLARVYPPLLAGWHQRRLAPGLTLSVFYGTAADALDELSGQPHAPVDVWLLDGFAPDRNPEMWTPELLSLIGATARQGTTVATFTAAGRVRRALAAAGFRMRRVDQRPHKRESLAGVFEPTGRSAVSPPNGVTVVGAGIAGATVSRCLAEEGIEVRVLDAAEDPPTGASRLPAAIMHPRLQDRSDPGAELRAIAYALALSALPGEHVIAPGADNRGALQVASRTFPVTRLAAVADRYADTGLGVILLDGREAADVAGWPSLVEMGSALYFPEACQLDLAAFTRALLNHPGIRLEAGRAARQWPAGTAILACGVAARCFAGASYLEMREIHGQLDRVRVSASAPALRRPLTGDGYLAPIRGRPDTVAIGATYEHTPWPADKARSENLARLTRLGGRALEVLAPVRGTRAVTSDRQPVIGALTTSDGTPRAQRLVSVGHGSMGTISSHLAATVLASQLIWGFTPLTRAQQALIDPARFRARQARRGYRFGARD